MTRPYIICHMMMALDGRIDCGMTVKIKGNKEYYDSLAALDCPSTLVGRNTAEIEMAEKGEFRAKKAEPVGQEGFCKQREAAGYTIVADSRGRLLWPDNAKSKNPLLILTSEKASKEYLAYLEKQHISWIACGKESIDLPRAVTLLNEKFGIRRMTIAGGGAINGAFLDAGLLDEISILLGPGIDGRKGMAAVFDGRPMDREPVQLKLKKVTPYEDGALWLRYTVAQA
jgi:2,5-diamino-6-(ribosylamino)-4(3H)-pyrimidinone 5'-phosphate reductase